MRKLMALFLLIVTVGMIFGGTASAALSVDVAVVHENGTLVNITKPGTDVYIDVVAATNNETLNEPQALIITKPDDGLTYDAEDAMMTWDGINWISNSDPISGGFLAWSEQNEAWTWAISQVVGPMYPGDIVELIIPAVVTDTGKITTDVIFEGGIISDDVPPAEDSYTFLSVGKPKPCNGQTVPMQSTGAPLALAALALLGIVGGSVYSKLR